MAPLSPRAAPPLPRLAPLLLVCLAGLLVTGFFLGLEAAGHDGMPIGFDTPRYLDQTNLVAELGLRGVPESLPPPGTSRASRAGFPVVLLALSGLFATTTFRMAAVVPGVAAAATALAAGAFASRALRLRPWEAGLVVVAVGLSPTLTRLFAPETYTDNLLAAALVMAALIPILSSAAGGGGFWAGAILLVAAGLAHDDFFVLTLAILMLTAVVLAPGSLRARREGQALGSTPTARLAGVVAAAAAGTALLFLVSLPRPASPKLTRSELRKKLREDLPLYLLPVTVPLGLAGAVTVRRDARRTAEAEARFGGRFLLVLSASWALVTVAGVAAFLAGLNSPAHRFPAFFLPLPILAVAALLAARRWISGRGRRILATAVVLAGIAGLTALGTHDLYGDLAHRGVRWITPTELRAATGAEAYLEAAHVPAVAPVVFVIDTTRRAVFSEIPEMIYVVRTALSPTRTLHAYAFVGTPADYLAGRPTSRTRTYDANAGLYWPAIRRLLPHDPVTLVLSGYNPAFGPLAQGGPDRVVAPGVFVLRGPIPTAAVSVPPIPRAPTSPLGLGLLGVVTLAAMGLAGLGWAVTLAPGGTRPFEVLALCPAVGIGAILVAGVLLDAAGLRLKGAGGMLAVVLAAGGGALAAILRRRRNGVPVEASGATPARS